MTTRMLFFISLSILLVSWILLTLSEFNADYFVELNMDLMIGTQPTSWLSFAVEDNRLFKKLLYIQWNEIPVFLLYWAPMVGILMAHKSKYIQYSMLLILSALLLLDAIQFLSFDGGDTKGCEFCFVWLGFHIAAGVLILTAGGLTGMWKMLKPIAKNNQNA